MDKKPPNILTPDGASMAKTILNVQPLISSLRSNRPYIFVLLEQSFLGQQLITFWMVNAALKEQYK
jgi:hypothetical protein